MTSDRQIAANRHNARRSTGPRSPAGKKRAAHNAYRHGLSIDIGSIRPFAKRLDDLAREIVDDGMGAISIHRARAVAEAELDVNRARLTKVVLIERVRAFGALESPPLFRTRAEFRRFLREVLRGSLIEPEQVDPASTMPSKEPDRTAEAVRRALAELLRLNRYESRAAARRERAMRGLFLQP